MMMAKDYEQLHYTTNNKPVNLISIFIDKKPGAENAPLLSSVLIRGDLAKYELQLQFVLEDYNASFTSLPKSGNIDYNFSNISAEQVKPAAAAVIRWLHEKNLLSFQEAKQAAVELKIPETIPIINNGFADKELTRMRKSQSDRAVFKNGL